MVPDPSAHQGEGPADDGVHHEAQAFDNAQIFEVDPERDVERLRKAVRARLGGQEVGEARVVIIVDQLEEMLTLCPDERERVVFLSLLSRLAHGSQAGPPLALVVLGLRADFYALCASYPQLYRALQSNQVLVRPMVATEMREA